MPFRPNYRQARGERDRAKQQKKAEKLRRRETDAARRKGELEPDAAPPAEPETAPPEGEAESTNEPTTEADRETKP